MLELPECNVIAKQMKETIVGKTIAKAVANSSPHGLAWYWGDPAEYGTFLDGKKINDATTNGGQIEIYAEGVVITFNDGANPRYYAADAKLPPRHQLHLAFADGDSLCCSVQMYGGIMAFHDGANDSFYHNVAREKPSPLSEKFDAAYFDSLFHTDTKPNMSAKAFLATKQRIPGLGNGVLQDILFNAGIHPKRKLQTMGDNEKEAMFSAVKTTLQAMTDNGGRDTEKDFFNRQGGYSSILSKNTLHAPCHVCGGVLTRQAFLGGNIYFCGVCQPLGG